MDDDYGTTGKCENKISIREISRLIRQLCMSVSEAMKVKELFDLHDGSGDGLLRLHEFEAAIIQLLKQQCQEDNAGTAEDYWWDSGRHEMTFADLLKWMSTNGFHEALLLTASQKQIRHFARAYNTSPDLVEKVQKIFDIYDADHSGSVTIDGFQKVLEMALNMAPKQKLPQSRVHFFWNEIDPDQSGTVTFEEFLVWWLKFGSGGGESWLQPELFYRQFKPIAVRRNDHIESGKDHERRQN
eukprot:NODE_15300_length_1057_cov_10.812903.p1 GENE.NODE_15300_length_1057_cov_10.812903~~NODE_15300_length_1057_cov_10.812903.p1  ORF type:complete len:272 (+),score=61.60 NODE_15300_length_1057_cov_10.812903:93-818(+)